MTRKLRDRRAVRADDLQTDLAAGHRLLMLSPDALAKYPRKARTHSKKQIRQIAASSGRPRRDGRNVREVAARRSRDIGRPARARRRREG